MENKKYLLTEASNHINHLYDNPQLTFKKIKEIISAAANGQLEGTEKVDGVRLLLSFSVYENKAKGARNKQDIKDGGKTANQLYKDFNEHYNKNLKDIFFEALNSFEKIIQGLDVTTQIELFGEDGNIYYISDIVAPTLDKNGEPLNVINYDTKNIVIHEKGSAEYDKETGQPRNKNISDKINKLRDIVLRHQEDLKHENFGIQISAIKRLKALNNKIPLNASINRINQLIKNVNQLINNQNLNLSDDSTINDFMIARIYILLNSILSKSPEGKEGLALKTKISIAKKIFGISGISTLDLRRNISKEQFKFVKINILDNKKQILKTAIQPLEIIISDFTVEMLKNLQSAYIVDDKKEVLRLRNKVKIAIKDIEKKGNQQDLINLKRQIQKLKNIEKISTSAEGFVFDYDGMTYKFTGSFAPVNQIMNLFKKINKKELSDEQQKNISEEETKKQNKIVLLAGSFKPPHKGHLEMVKQFLNLERPSKLVILISRLSREEINYEHSLQVWDMYLQKLNLKGIVSTVVSNYETPIQSAFEFMSNEDDNPEFAQDGDLVVLGFSNKNKESQLKLSDINKDRLKKKIDINVVPIEPKFNNLSSTDMRSAIRKKDINSLKNFIPEEYGSEKEQAAKEIISLIHSNNLSEQQINDIINEVIFERIVKKGKKYCLLSKKTGRNLGCFPSRKQAMKREKQVQYFKHLK